MEKFYWCQWNLTWVGEDLSGKFISFKYAKLKIGSDYSAFTEGVFKQSGLVHAFSLESIMEKYHMFKSLEITKYTQEVFEDKHSKITSVVYAISATK